MDFLPRVQRLIAEIEAVQLKADCSAVQLAAEVRQILLAATVDIEQRWQFLTPEDRVDALTDLIAVSLIYNRVFSDTAFAADLANLSTDKFLTETATLDDAASLQVAPLIEDVCPPDDVFARIVGYARDPEDAVEMVDAIETLLTLVRVYSDNFAVNDVPAKEAGKVFEDLGGLYVEAGYFADDYWQAGGPSPFDFAALSLGTVATDAALLEEVLATTVAFVRAYAEFTTTVDASTLSNTLAKADTATPSDSTAYALDAGYADTTTPAEQAALDFTTQMQELIAAAESFARTVDFARTASDSAVATDTPAKTFTAGLADTGYLYATVDYFADDYVERGTGPAVYDTFSYTLA